MDPLSLTIGAITLLGVCHKIVQGLKILENLSQIPDDIASLIDELSDLEQVLTTVCTIKERTVGQTKQEREETDELKALLLKASAIVVAVARHCGIALVEEQYCTTAADTASISDSPTAKFDLLTKFRWLKDQKKIIQFRQRLKVVRLDISNHLASQNLQNTYAILAEVRDLAEVCRRLSIEKSEPLVTSKALTMAVDTDVRQNAGPEPIDMECIPDAPPAYRRHPVSNMSSCSCACHLVRTFGTPRATKDWIGYLQIRTGGLPGLTPACDQVLCRQNKHASLHTSYRLPPWLSNRVFNTRFTSHNLIGPDLNLFSTRVISRNSQVFYYAMQGDLAGMKKLFSEGKASPYDVSHNYGYSALHYAVDYGHLHLCNFLIKAGAKPELQDFDNRTPTDLAYRKLMSEAPDQAWTGERVQEIFDQDAWLEQRQLTVLHKIVLGIANSERTLAGELSTSVKEVDKGDCDKRTPLSWAAELGNQVAVRTLLKFGADVNKPDCDGNTPVHYACKTMSGPFVLSILMDAGASALARNKWEQTPLNWVSFHQDDVEYARRLLYHPDVRASLRDDTDSFGSTPIGNAAFSGHGTMLGFLLDIGADPNSGIASVEIPLLDSISRNGHECLRTLLSRARKCNLNISKPDCNNETCLHYMARRGDVQTIDIMLEAIQNDHVDITSLRTADVGTEGLTPRNILALRGDDEVYSALERVLAIIDQETLAEMSSSSSEEMQFVEAFEMLQDLEKDIGMGRQPMIRVCALTA